MILTENKMINLKRKKYFRSLAHARGELSHGPLRSKIALNLKRTSTKKPIGHLQQVCCCNCLGLRKLFIHVYKTI